MYRANKITMPKLLVQFSDEMSEDEMSIFLHKYSLKWDIILNELNLYRNVMVYYVSLFSLLDVDITTVHSIKEPNKKLGYLNRLVINIAKERKVPKFYLEEYYFYKNEYKWVCGENLSCVKSKISEYYMRSILRIIEEILKTYSIRDEKIKKVLAELK